MPNFSVSAADLLNLARSITRRLRTRAAPPHRGEPPAAASAMLSHDTGAPPVAPPPVRGSLVLPAVPPPGSVVVAGGCAFWIAGVDVTAVVVTDGAGVPVGLTV